MPVKKKSKPKEAPSEKSETAEKKEYYCAVGRRKKSVARIRMYHADAGEKEMTINGKKAKDYFRPSNLQSVILSPLKSTGALNKFRLAATVRGGGFRGQAEALRLAVARALVKHDQSLKKNLRSLGF